MRQWNVNKRNQLLKLAKQNTGHPFSGVINFIQWTLGGISDFTGVCTFLFISYSQTISQTYRARGKLMEKSQQCKCPLPRIHMSPNVNILLDRAGITNHHRLSDEQQKVIFSWFWRLGHEIKVFPGLPSSEVSLGYRQPSSSSVLTFFPLCT